MGGSSGVGGARVCRRLRKGVGSSHVPQAALSRVCASAPAGGAAGPATRLRRGGWQTVGQTLLLERKVTPFCCS